MSRWITDAKGNSVQLKDIQCQQCHKMFEATRFDAKFCGANCRKKNERKLKGIDDLARDILRLNERLNAMATDANQDLRSKWAAQKALKRVRDELTRIR